MKTEAWPLLSVMFEVFFFIVIIKKKKKKPECEGNTVYIVFPNLLAEEDRLIEWTC